MRGPHRFIFLFNAHLSFNEVLPKIVLLQSHQIVLFINKIIKLQMSSLMVDLIK